MGTGLGWEGNRLAVQRTGNPLTILSSLAQSLVKRKWAPLGALKSVPTNLPLPGPKVKENSMHLCSGFDF